MKRNIGLIINLILACAMLLFTGCSTKEVQEEPVENSAVNQQVVDQQAVDQQIEENVSEKTSSKIPEFTTFTLEESEATEAIFANKDLTVLNIWGTYCNPCINEMPELGKWAKELPDNVQLVGLVIDIAGEEDTEQIELAQYIVEQTGADFTHLVANQDFMPLLEKVVGVPTTYFIDADGTILGEPIVGAYPDGYRQRVEEYVEAMEQD